MKKLITAIVAVMIIAFSAVPAFAISVNSPEATTQAETEPTKSDVKKDTNPVSPKTGTDSVATFSAYPIPYSSSHRLCWSCYSERHCV